MNADNIAVMDKGRLVEQGTHDSLLGIGGVYSSLVARQVLLHNLCSIGFLDCVDDACAPLVCEYHAIVTLKHGRAFYRRHLDRVFLPSPAAGRSLSFSDSDSRFYPPPPCSSCSRLICLQVSRAANTLQQESQGTSSSGGPADIDTLMDELEGDTKQNPRKKGNFLRFSPVHYLLPRGEHNITRLVLKSIARVPNSRRMYTRRYFSV